MTALVRLYPRAWRDRYEDEFLAVLDDRPPRLLDRLDILLGALDAHLDPEVPDASTPEATRPRRTLRGSLPAILAAAGGLLWIAAVAAMLVAPVDEFGHHDAVLSLVLVLLAQVTLAFAAVELSDRLPAQGRLLRGAGVLLLAGSALFFLGWPLLPLGLYAGFVASMAVGAAVVDQGGRLAGLALVFGSLLAFGMNTEGSFMLLALPIALGWMAVGAWSLGVRGHRPAPEPRDG